MIGLKLAIEQGEAAGLQSRDQPGERDLRGVGGATDHALAEKSAAQGEAVEPADQPIAVPAFDRMGMAEAMERDERLLDRVIDPGFGTIAGRLRAEGDDRFERGVGGDAETIGGDRLAQRTRKAESVKRQDRPFLGLDPINPGSLAVIGHREHADRIGAEHELRIEGGHCNHRGGRSEFRQGA